MSKSTEKENIAKLRVLVDQIEAIRQNEKALLSEVDKLLRKKYPSSGDRHNLQLFRGQLNMYGDLNKARQMLTEDKIDVKKIEKQKE